MGIDPNVKALAERQHLLVTRAQLRELDVSARVVARYERTGLLDPLTRRVLRLAVAPNEERQLAMAAVLDAGRGAALSFHAACALWGAPGYFLSDRHVSQPRDRLRQYERALAVLHERVALPDGHVTCWTASR